MRKHARGSAHKTSPRCVPAAQLVRAVIRLPHCNTGAPLSRHPCTPPCPLLQVHRNLDPALHPFEKAKEYTRALNAAKLERVFAKPFMASLEHSDGVTCLARNPRRLNCLLSGAADGEARGTRGAAAPLPLPAFTASLPASAAPGHADIPPSRRRLVPLCQQVRLWDVPARRCLRRLVGHTGQVKGISCTPDGEACVTAATDCTVKLWKVRLCWRGGRRAAGAAAVAAWDESIFLRKNVALAAARCARPSGRAPVGSAFKPSLPAARTGALCALCRRAGGRGQPAGAGVQRQACVQGRGPPLGPATVCDGGCGRRPVGSRTVGAGAGERWGAGAGGLGRRRARVGGWVGPPACTAASPAAAVPACLAGMAPTPPAPTPPTPPPITHAHRHQLTHKRRHSPGAPTR